MPTFFLTFWAFYTYFSKCWHRLNEPPVLLCEWNITQFWEKKHFCDLQWNGCSFGYWFLLFNKFILSLTWTISWINKHVTSWSLAGQPSIKTEKCKLRQDVHTLLIYLQDIFFSKYSIEIYSTDSYPWQGGHWWSTPLAFTNVYFVDRIN